MTSPPNLARDATLNHFDDQGRAHMVDVSAKSATKRVAIAEASVAMSPPAADAIRGGDAAKGDVIGVARLAGIMAAKQTQALIPLCHAIAIESVKVDFHWESDRLVIRSTVTTTGKTGVEMEAMTSASIAALTIYDMIKSVDRWVSVQHIRLLQKSGGKSGDVVRPPH